MACTKYLGLIAWGAVTANHDLKKMQDEQRQAEHEQRRGRRELMLPAASLGIRLKQRYVNAEQI